MPATLTIRDESASGQVLQEWSLDFLTEHITVGELIRSRVYQEVQDYNLKQPQIYHGLVQPTHAERDLNGVRLRKPRMIDWKEQFETAVEAFKNRQILILVDNRQVESLDEELTTGPGTEVSFLRLALLVGG